MIKAIETAYKGYRFRSRLEARWAVFFDGIGLNWHYEMQGFDIDGVWYLPDFYIPEWQRWLEIKPVVPDLTVWKEYLSVMKLALLNAHFARSEDGRASELIHMICGIPAMPQIMQTDSDHWRLKEGYVMFAPRFFRPNGHKAGLLNGVEVVPYDDVLAAIKSGQVGNGWEFNAGIECFSLVDGHRDLDIWPWYIETVDPNTTFVNDPFPNTTELHGEWKGTVSFPTGHAFHKYYGKGVSHWCQQFEDAANKAKAERFDARQPRSKK